MEINNVFDQFIACGTVHDSTALGLLALMAGISQDHYAAGWMNNLEYDLWFTGPSKTYGWREITERQATLLRLLSEECNGWWIWHKDQPKFVDLSAWQEILQKRSKTIERRSQ